MKNNVLIFVFICLFLNSLILKGQGLLSEEQTLKINAAHDKNRRNDFYRDQAQKKKFEQERSKKVDDYLTAERKFDQAREAGLADYLKSKKQTAPSEFGPEKKQDDARKREFERRYDQARDEYINIKKRYGSKPQDIKFEMEEYALKTDRPRYTQSARLHNKWLAQSKNESSGNAGGTSTSGSSNFNQGGRPPFVPGNNNAPSAFDQYQPGTDYIPPPPETFEDIPPPPPPPMSYDGQSVPYDAGFGDPNPPPPPPPMDFDF